MNVFQWIRLFFECFKVARWDGLRACFRFIIGDLKLDENTLKSCGFPAGGSDV